MTGIFEPTYSTNHIWVDERMEECLTTKLEATDSQIQSIQLNKAEVSHTHSGYAQTNHAHSGYASTNHTHSGYANENHVHDEYASTDHTHTGYASETHTHTGYAASTHTHSYNELSNLPTIPSLDGLATTQYVDTAVSGIVNSAPEALNTLNELASALGNDANFATTIATQIGTKVTAIDGKGLSTNDFTTAEKNKLAGIATGANKTIVDAALSATSTNPVQNKAIYDALTARVDKNNSISSTDLNTITEPGLYYVSGGSTSLNFPVGSNGHMLVMSDGGRIRQVFFRFGTINSNNFQWYSRSCDLLSTTNSGWSEWWLLSGSEQVYSGTAKLNTEICLGSRYGCQAWVIAGNVTTTGTVSTVYIPRQFLTTNQTKHKLQIADESGYVSFYFYYKESDNNVYAKIVWVSDADNSAIKYAYRIS